MKEIFKYSLDNKKFVEAEADLSIAADLTRLEGIDSELAEAEAKVAQMKAKREAVAKEIAAVIETVLGPEVKSIQGRGDRKFSIVRQERQTTDWRGLAEALHPPRELIEEYRRDPVQVVYYKYTPAKF